jgi:hypothetical protein
LAVGKNFLGDEPLLAAFNLTKNDAFKDFGVKLAELEKGLASKGLL